MRGGIDPGGPPWSSTEELPNINQYIAGMDAGDFHDVRGGIDPGGPPRSSTEELPHIDHGIAGNTVHLYFALLFDIFLGHGFVASYTGMVYHLSLIHI